MKDVILTPRGPKPIGPYSQAVKSNGFLFVSGQVALDPQSGEFVGADVRQQTERVLENLKAISGSGWCFFPPRGKDHRVSERHERFRGDERSLCKVFRRGASGALHRAGCAPAQRRTRWKSK